MTPFFNTDHVETPYSEAVEALNDYFLNITVTLGTDTSFQGQFTYFIVAEVLSR